MAGYAWAGPAARGPPLARAPARTRARGRPAPWDRTQGRRRDGGEERRLHLRRRAQSSGVALGRHARRPNPAGRTRVVIGGTSPIRGPVKRTEQRTRLGKGNQPTAEILLVRG